MMLLKMSVLDFNHLKLYIVVLVDKVICNTAQSVVTGDDDLAVKSMILHSDKKS